MELYENNYLEKNHFSFGKNWQNFLRTLNEERISEAGKSITNFLGEEDGVAGKTFVDIGCGSGLFSLAAYKLGAKKVVSVDIDDFSLACTEYLYEKEGKPSNWEIEKGSALDKEFIGSLGMYDIVYSWGVLHHTGNMYAALENIMSLPNYSGKMFIALYNDNKKIFEGSSSFWVKTKKTYNRCGFFDKKLIESLYTAYYVFGLLLNGRNPYVYIKNYKTLRGMNFMTDIKDWLGGYPYEYASVDQIINFFKKNGCFCIKTNPARSIGCNEFLFTKTR
jgi:2-polyprenyl-6-hydroxyphenyl methylase/3-demethylubiquinone-9 3-methyltransferase